MRHKKVLLTSQVRLGSHRAPHIPLRFLTLIFFSINTSAWREGHSSFFFFFGSSKIPGASQVVQWWRRCLPMQETKETRVQSLGQDDLLEEERATRSSIPAWKIPWTEEPGRLLAHGVAKSWVRLSNWVPDHARARTHARTHTHTHDTKRENCFQITSVLSPGLLWDCP